MTPGGQAPTFESSAGTMQPDEVCEDCGRPATVTLGTTALCQWCKWQVQAAILQRRPDLRIPEAGIGVPTGDSPDVGYPTLKCDVCPATWFGEPFMPCTWCEQRPELDRQIQESIDTCRLRDYLTDIREGSLVAVASAITLVKIAVARGTLPEGACRSLITAAAAGGFDLDNVTDAMGIA